MFYVGLRRLSATGYDDACPSSFRTRKKIDLDTTLIIRACGTAIPHCFMCRQLENEHHLSPQTLSGVEKALARASDISRKARRGEVLVTTLTVVLVIKDKKMVPGCEQPCPRMEYQH